MQKEVIVFNGFRFQRWPDHPERSKRVYFWPTRHERREHGLGALHVEIWKAAHGPIPKGHVIHHKDENPLNNALENLDCLTRKEHAKRHPSEMTEERLQHLAEARPLAAEWHSSPEGREWHSQHGRKTWENRQPVDRVCVQCGTAYKSLARRDTDRFCSRQCISRWNEATRRYYEDRHCVICGSTFNVKKSHAQQTCSRLCGAALRKQKRAA